MAMMAFTRGLKAKNGAKFTPYADTDCDKNHTFDGFIKYATTAAKICSILWA